MKLKHFLKIFENSLKIKFHENPSIGSQVVAYGRRGTQADGRTDRQVNANSRL